MKVLLCAAEVRPFVMTGGLADVAGALPKALAALGHDVRVMLPKHARMDAEKTPMELLKRGIASDVGGESISFDLYSSDAIPGVTTYLVDAPAFFDRKGLYGERDDAKRYGFFCRAVLESLPALEWTPEVIHCHDWHTALVPVYLKSAFREDERYRGMATVLSIHNFLHHGVFEVPDSQEGGEWEDVFHSGDVEFYGKMNFMKGGVLCADKITTVSPTYAKEIQTGEYAGLREPGLMTGLEEALCRRADDLSGIVNGLDTEFWNPATDTYLEEGERYGVEAVDRKSLLKRAVQRHYGLPESEAPLICSVGRVTWQKGLEIWAEAAPEAASREWQFVMAGQADEGYGDLFRQLAGRYPDRFAAKLEFEEERVVHQLYAGADMFLMPSRFEPCGLAQMIARRYGTVPVVRATGGLKDTVFDADEWGEEGNGFCFREYSAEALLGALGRALDRYADGESWRKLQVRGMTADFGWESAAREYVGVYEAARAGGTAG